MVRLKTAQELFKRERRPGDLVFAAAFLVFALFLATGLDDQVEWRKGTKLVAQPAFWPTVSVVGMTAFALLHWIGSVASPRIPGRWREVWFWVRSIEYAGWFYAYVLLVPVLGYLPASILFAVALCFRLGYRSPITFGLAVLLAVVTVVTFRGFLQVKVPAGALYQYLPDGLRLFAQIYL